MELFSRDDLSVNFRATYFRMPDDEARRRRLLMPTLQRGGPGVAREQTAEEKWGLFQTATKMERGRG